MNDMSMGNPDFVLTTSENSTTLHTDPLVWSDCEMTVLSRFGPLLAEKELRENHKYTYREISEITGVDKNMVGIWIKGRPKRIDASVLEAFCKFLGCKVGELLVIEDDKND